MALSTATLPQEQPATTILAPANRIYTIDLLRGLVMAIMALDHVRDYFHADAQLHDPLDMATTHPALFFTRWITHFCAPTFVLLSGVSACLYGWNKSKNELAFFLLTRGLWLLLMEATLVTLGWTFDLQFRILIFQVIWAIGMSMILLSAIVYLPRKAILLLGLALVAGHNVLDPIHLKEPQALRFAWSGLHEFGIFQLTPNTMLVLAYPILPWLGLMTLGYCLGSWYAPGTDSTRRRKFLALLGSLCLLGFLALRLVHAYGDAQGFEVQRTGVQSVYDFFNTTKYPPSLHFLLMTMGPALLFLALFDRVNLNRVSRFFIHIGRVPFFYYLLHIYLIHGLAVLAAFASGFTWDDFVFGQGFAVMPKGYGFSLATTYGVWLLVLGLLYPLCAWYAGYKARHRDNPLLSYL